jgi:dTDP-4-dehydrorhamnose reductase
VKILVTGREGQLARSLAERARTRPELKFVAIGRPIADLVIPGSMAAIIEANRPDVVVNAAAYTAVDQAEDEPELAFRINAEAAGEVAAAARDVGASILQISTDYVFDGSATGAYDEDAAPNPVGVYGRSKLAGEERVRAAFPASVIVRTAWVYSPFGRNFVRTMFEAAGQHDELRVVADQRGSPTSALDLADGLLAMVDRWRDGERTGQGETYHLAGSDEASWDELARAVMEARARLGLRVARVEGIRTEDWPTKAERPRNSVLDSGKFERHFGFTMPDWRASVETVVARLAESGHGTLAAPSAQPVDKALE